MKYKIFNRITIFTFIPFLMVSLCGCSVKYTTSGASINYSDVKTASVQYFINRAPLGSPKLAQLLTEKLKDKILSQTRLKIVSSGMGDVNLEGFIKDYSTLPMAVQGGNNATAALNRLSVTVKLKYNNSKDGQYDYDTEFTRYKDYDSQMSAQSAEDQYLEKEIVDKLVEDIFNRAFVNW